MALSELDALDLGKIGVGSFIGMPLAGVATGTIDLDLPEEISAGAGEIDLEIAGVTIGDGKNKMKLPGMAGGLTLDPLDAGTLKLKLSLKEGVAAIETLEAKGKDLVLDGSGSLRLAPQFERSKADITLGFKKLSQTRPDAVGGRAEHRAEHLPAGRVELAVVQIGRPFDGELQRD